MSDDKLKSGAVLAALAGAVGASVNQLKNLLGDPTGYVEEVVSSWFADIFIDPIADIITIGFASLTNAIITVAWGADQNVFYLPQDGGQLGLFDLPLWVSELLANQVGASVAGPIQGLIAGANEGLVALSEQLGVAAPALIPLAWIAIIAFIAYATMFILRTIDVPFVDQGPILDLLTAPVKRLVRWLSS